MHLAVMEFSYDPYRFLLSYPFFLSASADSLSATSFSWWCGWPSRQIEPALAGLLDRGFSHLRIHLGPVDHPH
jgi:hypothetical protein